MTIIWALVLAHLLGDFVLQSDRQVSEKKELKLRAYLAHGGVIAGAMIALSWLAGGRPFILLAMSVAVLHVAQDLGKARLHRRFPLGPGWAWIALDQVAHLLMIIALALAFGAAAPHNLSAPLAALLHRRALYVTLSLAVLGTWVAGVLLREALSPLVPRPAHPSGSVAEHSPAALETAAGVDAELEAAASEAFVRTSFWIGIVERVIVISAVAMAGGQGLATAGLVVAAKSVFRWRDLTEDPGAVQYFLLGTLASIAVAVVDGLLVRRVLG